MKEFIQRMIKNKTARYIFAGASYVFLTVLFFGIGYTVGTETGKGLITTPVSVASPAEDNTPAPTAASAAPVHEPGYRLVLEAGELRLYNNYNGSLISGTAINETLFPKSDIESLKAGLSFKTLEEALGMMENFLS